MMPSSSACGEGREREEILYYLRPNAYFGTGPQLANSVNEIEFLLSSHDIFGAAHYLYEFFSQDKN